MSNRDRVGRTLLSIARCIFIALFAFLSAQIILQCRTAENSIVKDVSLWRFLIAFLVLAASILFTIYIDRYIYKGILDAEIWHRLLWCIWLFVQILYIWGTYSQPSSDCLAAHVFGFDLANASVIDPWYVEIFAIYSNNILLVMVSWFLLKVIPLACINDVWLVTSVLAGIFADITVYYTVKLVARKYGEKFYAVSFAALCLLIGLSEEASILYSDILSLWTIPFAVYKLEYGTTDGKWINYILAGAALGVGVALKPQIAIFLIAWAIVSAIEYCIRNPNARKMIPTFAVVALCLCTYRALSGTSMRWYCNEMNARFEEDAMQYIEDHSFPMLHWMDMGLNSRGGTWNTEDVQKLKEIVGKENKNAFLEQSIRQRFSEMGIEGWGRFANRKVVFALRNGSFSQDLVWKGICLNNQRLAKETQKYFVTTSESWRNGLGVLIQMTYMLCLVGAVWNAIANLIKKKYDTLELTAEITLIGDVIFLALFECNIRYFYSVLPLLIYLAFGGAHCLFDRKENG